MSAAGLFAMAACSGGANDVADQVEERADARADAIEQNAGAAAASPAGRNIVEQQADQVRQAGEERADAIRDSDLDDDALTDTQKNALIADDGTPHVKER